ncbi:Protein CYCLOPS [Linum grandiflorum]
MDTEGRGFSSDLCRNTSEELFIKSLMETSSGVVAPTMEMLGFKNLSQNIRTDSEELFKSWLTTGENNHGYGTPSIAHRTRQASKRMSNETTNFSSHQHGMTLQKERSTDVLSTQNHPATDDMYNRQLINKGTVDKNMQASNLYLAKAWFQSSQPMTRSRSSELRKRYVAMQTSGENGSANDEGGLRHEFSNQSRLGDPSLHDVANQMGTFMSPSNSSSSTFNTPQSGNVDNVSSVVNMLKGTLERKKLGNQTSMGTMEDNSNAIYQHGYTREVTMNPRFEEENQGLDSLQELASAIAKNPVNTSFLETTTVQQVMNFEMEGFANPVNSIQMNTVSREPSPSESSAAAPVVSSRFDGYDGASHSSQNVTSGSSKKAVANGSEQGGKARDIRERIIDNLKDDRKKLVRYGSITSATSVDIGDPTKKRRVERSRKMAEAKERSSTPAIPSDMQSVTKRCELLEKEVRSLKLNLSFMNRKDSEQTKQIEDLQKQNEELTEEKERLLEEMERILSETGKF